MLRFVEKFSKTSLQLRRAKGPKDFDVCKDISLSPCNLFPFPVVVCRACQIKRCLCFIELRLGLLFSGLRDVSEIDCSGSTSVIVNGVDHSTSNERISQRFHVLCVKINNFIKSTVNSINKSLTTIICGFTRNLRQ